MSYATLAELKTHTGTDAYAALTDLAGGSAPSDTVGQQRLDGADGFVNGKLGQRYQVPVDVSDATRAATLRTITLAIALFKLYADHPARPDIPKSVRDDHDANMKLLDEYAAGKPLPGATEAPATTGHGEVVTVFGNDAMLTMDRMAGL
jgi:phage gp36-like protein